MNIYNEHVPTRYKHGNTLNWKCFNRIHDLLTRYKYFWYEYFFSGNFWGVLFTTILSISATIHKSLVIIEQGWPKCSPPKICCGPCVKFWLHNLAIMTHLCKENTLNWHQFRGTGWNGGGRERCGRTPGIWNGDAGYYTRCFGPRALLNLTVYSAYFYPSEGRCGGENAWTNFKMKIWYF